MNNFRLPKHKISVCFCFIALSSLCFAECCAASNAAPQARPYFIKGYIDTGALIVAWLNKPWTGDDAPYAAVRSEVDSDVLRGDLHSKIAGYQAAYAADPTDLAKQIRYVYALWADKWWNGYFYFENEREQTDMDDFTDSLWRQHRPNTFNYTRMAAICCDSWGLEPGLLPFVQRLLKKDPGDLPARFALSVMLSVTGKAALQTQAITDANILENEYPTNANIRMLQGSAYYCRWNITKDPALAQKSIAAYKRFLDLAPPNDFYRQLVIYAMGNIQKAEGGTLQGATGNEPRPGT
jgi:tetratricopeptide (TPR) repeat protein